VEKGMSEQAPAIVGIAALVIDCADPPALARWWSRLLGGSVEVDPGGDATLHTRDGMAIDFQRVPEPKTVKNRLHLDVRSSDLAEATEQAIALGATRADDIYAGGRWQVLRDPEGNEFCLLRPRS
jgi:Glyoxalase-like domain